MKTLKIAFFALLFVGGVTGPAIIVRMDKAQEQRFIEIMKTQTEFSGTTVDALWHWRQDHKTSAEFNDLYDKKIKNIPGWSYGDNRVDR